MVVSYDVPAQMLFHLTSTIWANCVLFEEKLVIMATRVPGLRLTDQRLWMDQLNLNCKTFNWLVNPKTNFFVWIRNSLNEVTVLIVLTQFQLFEKVLNQVQFLSCPNQEEIHLFQCFIFFNLAFWI